MKNKQKTIIPAILFCSLIFISISATSQDKADVWVHLNVEALYEEHFLAGDPPTRVNTSSDIRFTHSGLYTINRIGSHYMVVQNFDASGPRALVPGLKVIQTHPCQDGQSLLIGRAEKEIPAELYKIKVSLGAKAEGEDRVGIHFWPVEIDLEGSDCKNSQCVNGFGFTGIYDIGEDPGSAEEDEDGYEDISGYELLTVDFKLLRDIGTGGGEIPLTIPISINKTHSEVHETSTGPVEHVYNFSVTGWIGAPAAGK
ncbi:MAG: hypothetical protein LC649_10820 [Bacteroidales bacterium]|nr:hypothetical protein [Bacteroidales bacterium]